MDVGERLMLNYIVQSESGQLARSLRLYKNDYTPVPTSAVADFVEATFPGSEGKFINHLLWSAAVTVAGEAVSQYDSMAQQWTNTGEESQTVYGYYVTNEDGDEVLWAQRFTDPINVEPDGTIQVWPSLAMKSRY